MNKNPAIGQDNVSVSSDGTKIQGKGFVIVGSDVEKLYPSLRPLEGTRLTRMAVIESNIDIIDIDHRKALRYLYVAGGMEFLERSGLTNWAPKWLGKRSDLLSVSGEKTNKDSYWRDSSNIIPRKIGKKIVAAVLEIGVIVTMGTHLYSFCGKTFVQLVGGPIGLRLTAALANLIMCFFDRSLRQLLTRELIKINLSFRFVDDSRYGLRPIEPGWR